MPLLPLFGGSDEEDEQQLRNQTRITQLTPLATPGRIYGSFNRRSESAPAQPTNNLHTMSMDFMNIF
jgi:hypothetical protein